MSLLHFVPRSGWMNDPNGLIFYRGRHHLFFQHEPDAVAPQRLRWGHASSVDLITWTEHPAALVPGEEYDADGCWSGCAVDVDGRIGLLYTALRDGKQRPCLAWADDDRLLSFTKDPANPVIIDVPEPNVVDFRDHTVVRDDDGRWFERISGATAEGRGAVFGYQSYDFLTWTYTGLALDSSRSRVPGVVWECPDWFLADGTDILVLSVIAEQPNLDGLIAAHPEVWWSLGHDDGERFHERAVGPLDVGDRFYAPQSYWAGERRIMIGWIRTHQDRAWAADSGAAGVMSLPRQLVVDADTVHVLPVQELLAARGQGLSCELSDGEVTTLASPIADAPCSSGELELDAAGAARLRTVVLVDKLGRRFCIDSAPFADVAGALRLFFDVGVVEAFRGGLAGTWSDVGLQDVESIEIKHTTSGTGTASWWSHLGSDGVVASEVAGP